MSARVTEGWSYEGQPVIRVENRHLAADLVASMGAKVLNLIDKAGDRNVLWRAPRVPLRPGPLGANVDDYFAGGWDDAFPTGDACTNERGDELPYMGEVWNLEMKATVLESGPGEARVSFSALTPITPARITRTVRLAAEQPLLSVETRIENVGHLPFEFCWGSHAALAVQPGTRLDVPAAYGEVTDAGAGLLGGPGETYRYPLLRRGTSEERDVTLVPGPELGGHALHALSDLAAPWAAATQPDGRGFALRFDRDIHRCVWQWMSYGGFRGWYHVILEPWTAAQTSLAAAREAGTARRLAPGESICGSVTGILYAGLSRVTDVGEDGAVTGS